MKTPTRTFLPLVLAVLVAACGSGDAGGSDGSADTEAAETSGPWPAQPTGAVDEELAERGEEQFRVRGCVACHTIGEGRLVGPDLAGVTERRSYDWTMAMITNPDSMLRTDSIARQLLSEYFTPMSNQGVTPEQARAIWEHLREEGAEAGEESGD